ncbi:MAG: hypothetical protein QOH88_368 [Verrucomicrobiota bacterium]|jgi:hypothetical protein
MKSADAAIESELRALETGALDPAMFPHPEHVRLGYEMLGRYSFGEALARFSRGLKLLCAKAGRPQVYHETITVAFLALIAERCTRTKHDDWDDFKAKNSDLLDKHVLTRWYRAEQLGSDLARKTFCLPARISPDLPINPAGRSTWPTEAQSIGWYSGIFSAYIIWSSAVTLRSHGEQHAVALLAAAEIAAALLFAFGRTRRFGLVILLAIFAVATVADFAHGGFPFRFLFYAASALLIVRLVRPAGQSA